jgi:polysaccharide export outer membrane protein
MSRRVIRAAAFTSAERGRRAFVLTLCLTCVGFLHACNSSLSDDGGLPEQHASLSEDRHAGHVSPAAHDKAEVARAAERYVASTTPGSSGYKIGPQDVLDITVFQAPDLSKSVQVAEAGMINLPLVGTIPASGKTATEIERDLQAKLGAKYLKSPQVSVYVKEFNSQRVTVQGAVKKPGVFPFRGHYTLMQTIAMAEGMDKDLASSDVVVFRTTDGAHSAIRFDVDNIRSGRSPDPEIQAGDLIVVDDSAAKAGFNIFKSLVPLASPFFYFI